MVRFLILLSLGFVALTKQVEAADRKPFQVEKHLPSGINVNVTYGLDVSSLVSISSFDCLRGQGYDFAIVRGYRSDGEVDDNARTTIANAKAAGIRYVDVYLFPCPTCNKNASQQVEEMVNSLSGSNYGQIWLDVEGSQYWYSSQSENQRFFQELLSSASGYKTTGVYASESQWSSIMGSSYTGGSRHQLWYPHYDGNPSFSDFQPFGGWTTPAIKQYAANKSVCGAFIDQNAY